MFVAFQLSAFFFRCLLVFIIPFLLYSIYKHWLNFHSCCSYAFWRHKNCMWKQLIRVPAFSPLLGFFLMYTRETHFLLSLSTILVASGVSTGHESVFTFLRTLICILWQECYCTIMKSLTSAQLHSLVSRFHSGPDPKPFTIIPSLLFLSLSYIHWKLN